MRFGRWLLAAAILVISIAIGDIYVKRRDFLATAAPAPPRPLEKGIEGRADKWSYTQTDGGRPRAHITADSMRQIQDPSVVELEGVELQIFHQDGKKFDLVKSAKAQFDINAKSLYSEGEVEITMGVEDGAPVGHLMKIHTSGARFASDTGVATTDRAATFEFDRGGGSAVGVDYDPSTRELHLRSNVILDWRGKPGATPMHGEAGEAQYRERESKVVLYPWSKLTRNTLTMDAAMSVILLKDGNIRRAEIASGKGVQDDEGRKVEFAADQIALDFDENTVVRKIVGDGNASVVSTNATARTTITGKRLDMDLTANDKESVLTNAVVSGSSVAESAPLGKSPQDMPDTRVLRSETIHMKMRAPDGKEVESAETDGPGTLDFLPNRPGQPKRFLSGDHFWIAYGAENRIQSFRSVNVKTRTERPATPKQPTPPPALTESQDIFATFNPTTSEMDRMEQNKAFHYEEGDRQARADKAVLEQSKDLITLEGSARVWDSTGLSTGDHILMNQKSGDYSVDGHVASTRQPDKKGQSSAMLSNDEVLQARADHMTAANNHQKIHYEGNAVAWQGANRVNADKIDIDRQRHVMEANGMVVSQFVDKDKDKDKSDDTTPGKLNEKKAGAKETPQAPIFTVVRAPHLDYADDTRIAFYSGGVALARPGLTVEGQTLKAYLKDASEDSSLDKAFTDGAVKIISVTTTPEKRIKTGTSEHSEYYATEQKVILEGGAPLLVDSIKGKTTGKQLTWYANNDRLLVDGHDESKPAESNLRKKKK
jgi:lipopolysaccharide export system protein LptA